MADEQELRVDVVNNDEFMADEVSVSHSPIRFVIDFKSINPRMDFGNQPPRMVIRHNVVLVDPFFARDLLNVLVDNIAKYEKKYGQIKRPEALARHEADAKKTASAGSAKAARQDYFG